MPVWLFAGVAAAQIEESRHSPAGPGALFGVALAVEGTTAVVTAAGRYDADRHGSPHVYVHDGLRWSEQQVLTASDGYPGDSFGSTVALSGATLLVGSLSGKAYVFVNDGTRWVEQQFLAVTGLGAAELFGTFVTIDGDTAAVAAQREDAPEEDSGAAYVFVRRNGTWSHQQRLAPAALGEDSIAGVCALGTDVLLLGAPGKDASRGSVFVFTRSGSVWTQRQELTASDARPLDAFGARIAMDGDTAVVTAFVGGGFDFSGKAYVFERDGTSWIERQMLTAKDGRRWDLFGHTVSLCGDAVAIGAPGHDGSGRDVGAAYLYTRDGTYWAETRKLEPGDAAVGCAFGAVAVSDAALLVGAAGHDEAGEGSGRLYAFRRNGEDVTDFEGQWLNADRLAAGTVRPGETWTALIGVAGANGPGCAFLFVSDALQAGTTVLGGRAEILLGGRLILRLGPRAHAGRGTSAPFALPVLADPSLVGRTWVAQGVVTGGGLGLTNAVTGTVR